MENSASMAHACARLASLSAMVLGMLVLGSQTPTLLGGLVSADTTPPALVGAYFYTGVAVLASLWTLGFLAARSGVPVGFVGLAALAGIAVPLIGLTADWRLYTVAGLGALVESEDLAARIRHARTRGIRGRTETTGAAESRSVGVPRD